MARQAAGDRRRAGESVVPLRFSSISWARLPPWRPHCCCRRWPPPSRPRRNSSPSRSGRSPCRRTGFSARSPASPSIAHDNIWIIHRPATLLDDEKGAQTNPPETQCCTAGAAGAEVRSRGQSARLLGRPDRGPAVGQERARHPRRPRRQCLARRQQRRRPDSEIHAGRKIPPADRQGRRQQRLGVADPARPAGAHDDRSGGGRTLCRRRLRQPPRHRVRCQDRRLQADVGRLRQAAERRKDAGVQARRQAVGAVRQSGPLRAAVERRPGLCLRPRQQPHPGVPQGRHLREGIPRHAGDAGQRLGVGPRAVGRRRRRSSSSWPTAPTARSSR